MGRSAPPKQLGAYELLGLLATGGMAEVFLARKRGASDDTVVVKRVLPHLARQKAFHDMFLDEARIVSRIAHPNVVSMHELCDLSEAGGGDDELFLVMEHLHGESLSALAKQLRKSGTAIPIDVALHIGVAAAAGLHAAHELKNDAGKSLDIVHRDVSPQNLFVLYSGGVKVIDFGIAKAAERQAGHTQTGHVKGKFAYMPPEQIGAQQVDRRVDVFALGVVLHELVTGQRLFEREHDLLVLKAICEDPVPPPSAKRADVPPEVDAVIMKALERGREKRFATADAMRAALEAARAALPPAEIDATTRLAALMRTLFADRIARQRDLVGQPARSTPAAEASSPGPSGPNTDPSLSNPLPRTPPSPAALVDVARRDGAAPTLESSPPSGIERSDVGQAISIAGAPPIQTATQRKRGPWIAVGAAAATAAAIGLVLALRGGPETSASGAMAPPSAKAPPPTASPSADAGAKVEEPKATAAASSSAPTASGSSSAAPSAVARAPQTTSPPTNATTPTAVPKSTSTPTAKPKPTSTGFTRFE